MIVEAPSVPPAARAPRMHDLPEPLAGRWQAVLIATDTLVALCASLVPSGAVTVSMRLALASLCAGIVVGILALAGSYRQSLAVHERDEIYHVVAPLAFAAVPFCIVLSTLGLTHRVGVVVALALLFGGIGTMRMLLHAARRAGRPCLYAGVVALAAPAYQRVESIAPAKRVFDLVFASLALVIASPVMLAVAIAIYRESGRPVFFRQERVGKHGRTFWIYKFRTMRHDADSQWARPGDPRITRLGAFLRRTSLDELPQLFNVLRGEMSIVGPRPEMQSFASEFERSIGNYAQRTLVAPGITGWAQLYLARNLQPDDMPGVLPYDLFYVEHASPLLDMALICKTAVEFLFHRAV